MVDPSAQHVRQVVEQVLAEPDYGWWHTPAASGGLLSAILRALGPIVEWFATLRAEQPAAYWTLLVALVVLAFALLAHAAWTVRVAVRAQAGDGSPPGAPARPDYRSLAAALAARGEYLEAARHVQLAVLEVLVARRVITLTRSEANGVLRDRLRGAVLPNDDRGLCLALLGRLERACFRDHLATEDLYRAWCSLHERLARETA